MLNNWCLASSSNHQLEASSWAHLRYQASKTRLLNVTQGGTPICRYFVSMPLKTSGIFKAPKSKKAPFLPLAINQFCKVDIIQTSQSQIPPKLNV